MYWCAAQSKDTPVAEVDEGEASRLACLAVVGDVYPGNRAEARKELLHDGSTCKDQAHALRLLERLTTSF